MIAPNRLKSTKIISGNLVTLYSDGRSGNTRLIFCPFSYFRFRVLFTLLDFSQEMEKDKEREKDKLRNKSARQIEKWRNRKKTKFSVTRLGDFLNFLVTNFLIKVAQIFLYILGYFKYYNLHKKLICLLKGNIGKYWATFKSIIRSHCAD